MYTVKVFGQALRGLRRDLQQYYKRKLVSEKNNRKERSCMEKIVGRMPYGMDYEYFKSRPWKEQHQSLQRMIVRHYNLLCQSHLPEKRKYHEDVIAFARHELKKLFQ